MELWIRSQDKTFLRKIDNVYIAQTLYQTKNGGYSVKYEGQQENIYTLGEYQSQERALEVLDEIQNFITRTDGLSYVQNSLGIEIQGTTEKGIIYNMPQE